MTDVQNQEYYILVRQATAQPRDEDPQCFYYLLLYWVQYDFVTIMAVIALCMK